MLFVSCVLFYVRCLFLLSMLSMVTSCFGGLLHGEDECREQLRLFTYLLLLLSDSLSTCLRLGSHTVLCRIVKHLLGFVDLFCFSSIHRP